MSDDQVNVSYEAIAELESALGRFAQACLEKIELAERAIDRARDQLENQRIELRHEISRLQSAISAADEEEDVTWEERRLEEAQDELSNIQRWQSRIEDCIMQYNRDEQRIETLCAGTTTEARGYLRGLLSDLSAYFQFQKNSSISISSAPTTNTDAAPCDGEGSLQQFDPTSFSLPPGYRWVQIRDLNVEIELKDVQNQSAFEKVTYEEMRRGFDALRNEVLPAVTDARNPANADTFARRDLAAGVKYEHGLQRVYEAFFGADPIYLSRGRDAAQFSITSGRHRIKAAIDAGWTAVPAKTSDLSTK